MQGIPRRMQVWHGLVASHLSLSLWHPSHASWVRRSVEGVSVFSACNRCRLPLVGQGSESVDGEPSDRERPSPAFYRKIREIQVSLNTTRSCSDDIMA